MESQVWPMSVLTVALPVLRVPQLVLTGADRRRERLRRAASSSAAPPGKNTTAAAAVQPPAHAGERTLSGTVPGGILCDVGSRPGDAFLRNIRLGHTHTHTRTHTHTHAHRYTHTHTHTHTHLQCSTVTAWLKARGAASCGCFLPVVPVMPRLAPMFFGWAAGPLQHAAEVRGRSLLQQQGALRASAIARASCMPPCSRPINKPAWDPRSVYHAAASTYAIRRNDSTFVAVANANRPKPRAHRCTHAARTHARTSC